MTKAKGRSNVKNPTARHLLLNLLLASDHDVLSATEAVRACALFDISQNSARVALAHHLASGLIETVERGEYRLGPAGRALGDDVKAWRHAERSTKVWDGSWIAVSVSGAGRSDRVALRRRERALALVGLQELDAGLFVRPNNFTAGADGTRERLYALGLEQEAPVFVARELSKAWELRARALWDAAALARSYREGKRKLEKSLANLKKLSPQDAAREAFLLGDQAVRQLVFDPMLPEPLVSVDLRRTFAETVRRYDAAGAQAWRRFIAGS